jgi:hypothetical protein
LQTVDAGLPRFQFRAEAATRPSGCRQYSIAARVHLPALQVLARLGAEHLAVAPAVPAACDTRLVVHGPESMENANERQR